MIDVQLKLNLGGVVLSLRIWGYTKVNDDDWHSIWCKTDFAFKSGDWLNYHAEACLLYTSVAGHNKEKYTFLYFSVMVKTWHFHKL